MVGGSTTRRAAIGLALLALTACGTRLPDDAFVEDGELVAIESTDGEGAGTAAPGALEGATETTVAGDTTADTTADAGAGGGSVSAAASGGGGGGAAGPNQASDVGVTEDQIVIGNITAENGVLGDAFAPAARGMRAWAAAMNAKGGIHGRQVVLKTCDDGEVRTKTLECAKRLVEQDKAFAIVGANTRAMGGAAQYLNDKGVPVLGMPITNSYNRYPHFFSFYATGYQRDGKTVGNNGNLMFNTGIYRWFKENLKVTKAAVFSYDIPESKQAGDAFAQGLKLEGFSVKQYTVSFAAPSFDQAVATMQQDGTQIIVDSMDDGANRKLCDAMARRRFSVKAKVSTVVSMGDKVGTAYNDTCRNSVFIPGSTLPYSQTGSAQVKAFRDAFARYQPGKPVHQWALEAWLQGQLVAEALEKMGPAPTRKGLEGYFNGLTDWTGGGVHTGLDWKPIQWGKTMASCITIARWQDSKGGWVQATQRFPYCYPDAKVYGSPALEQGN
jgi:ABC-type branched-subunit amino acid transport system substrate-binding protein